MEIIIEGKNFEVVNADNFKQLESGKVQATATKMVANARLSYSCSNAAIRQFRTDGKTLILAMGNNTLFSCKL